MVQRGRSLGHVDGMCLGTEPEASATRKQDSGRISPRLSGCVDQRLGMQALRTSAATTSLKQSSQRSLLPLFNRLSRYHEPHVEQILLRQAGKESEPWWMDICSLAGF